MVRATHVCFVKAIILKRPAIIIYWHQARACILQRWNEVNFYGNTSPAVAVPKLKIPSVMGETLSKALINFYHNAICENQISEALSTKNSYNETMCFKLYLVRHLLCFCPIHVFASFFLLFIILFITPFIYVFNLPIQTLCCLLILIKSSKNFF